MKKLILKSSVLIALVLGTLYGVIYLLPVDPNISLAATIDKHRLLETTPQPRIIFAGDSNIAYGINSAEIKKATGYNIINMGLHGGLGLMYYLDELKPYLKKNDIVIIILDYQNFFGDGGGANTLVEITIFNPKILLYYSPKNLYNFVAYIPHAFQRRLFGLTAPKSEFLSYSRSGFNRYGDYEIDPRRRIPKLVAPTRDMPLIVGDIVVGLLNDFSDTWGPRGVRVYMSFSPLLIQDKEKQVAAVRGLAGYMKKKIKIPLIGDPEKFMYPPEYFYDNLFHLNVKGREVRTKDLISEMLKIPELASAGK